MFSRVNAVALLVVLGAGCLGAPDLATEEATGSALSADGRRMRLIYRNRGWSAGKEAYELYSKVPYVSSSSVTVMGLRLALPSRWDDNSPVNLITFDTRWWNDAQMAVAIYHRPENNSSASWEPLRCTSLGSIANGDLQYFRADQALIDLQNGELELAPIASGAGSSDATFERDNYSNSSRDGRYQDSRYQQDPVSTQLQTFSQCGINEQNPEFSAFVFPYRVSYWNDRFDYDFAATCDGDPCPAYRGDPNEPRRRSNNSNNNNWNNNNNNNWNNNNNNNNWNNNNVDPNRTSWDISDDSVWQCGRTTTWGAGNVSSVRVEIRGRHTRPSELEATIKKVGGMTNVGLFPTNSGLTFPIVRTVSTSNETFAGTWELCVRDTSRGDTGRVDGWSITQDAAGFNNNNNNNNNNNVAGVVSVTAGASRSDSLAVGESDWYSITLQANQTLTVETSGTACQSNSLDTVVSLHSSLAASRPNAGSCAARGSADWSSGAYLDCQDQAETGSENGYCSRMEERVSNAGTYYVRVFSYGNEDSGAYTVSFQVR